MSGEEHRLLRCSLEIQGEDPEKGDIAEEKN